LVYHEFSLHPANHVHVKPTLCNEEALGFFNLPQTTT
jgi:hypothetical protein